MIDFLKNFNFKRVLPLYISLFLSMTVSGFLFNFGNLGFNFSVPVTLVVLLVDLVLTYRKYKECPRN